MESFATKAIKGISSILKPRFKILAYHSVGTTNYDPYDVTTEDFEKQMCFLVKQGYNVISLEDAYRGMQNQCIRDKTIVITFDDGAEKLGEFAFPILKNICFPATVFLPVKYIGGVDGFSYEVPKADGAILNWSSIESSLNNGISYGSHTMSHPNLVIQNDNALQYELYESRMILKERLGLEFHALAYPFGKYDDRIKDATRRCGYNCALGFYHILSNTMDTDLFELKREKVDNSTSLRDFAKLVDIRNDLSRGTGELIWSTLRLKH